MLILTKEHLNWLRERIPDSPREPRGGRPPADKKKVFAGIFWVLDNGAKWKDLPAHFGSKHKTLDGRALRRYKRRWTVERTIAWLQHDRWLCIRCERSTSMFRAFLHFGRTLLLIRQVLG